MSLIRTELRNSIRYPWAGSRE